MHKGSGRAHDGSGGAHEGYALYQTGSSAGNPVLRYMKAHMCVCERVDACVCVCVLIWNGLLLALRA